MQKEKAIAEERKGRGKCFFSKMKKPEEPQNAVIYPPAFNDYPSSLHITTDYADNKIFSRELHLSLSARDWCEFVKQDF